MYRLDELQKAYATKYMIDTGHIQLSNKKTA